MTALMDPPAMAPAPDPALMPVVVPPRVITSPTFESTIPPDPTVPDQIMPPADEEEILTVKMVNNLRAEASSALDIPIDGVHSLRDYRTIAGRRYLGDQWDTEPRKYLSQFTINRTQNAIITTVAVQTQEPVSISFTPRETDEPPQFVLTANGAQKLADLVKTGQVDIPVEAQALQVGQILDPQVGVYLSSLMAQRTDPATGQVIPPLLTDDDLIVVNDTLAGKAVQLIFDALWENAIGDFYVTHADLNANIFGDQAVLCQWNADTFNFSLILPHYANVWFDPTCLWIKDANYCGFDQVMPIDKAKRLFPKFAKQLELYGSEGFRPAPPSGTHGVVIGEAPWPHVQFRSKQVTVRTLWKRNEVVIEPGQPTAGEVDPATGQPGPDVPGQMMRRVCIRQVQTLVEIDRRLDDRECPYSEIPMPWVKNIPAPYGPHGLGEPIRLEDIQTFINRLASILANHIRYYQFPQEFWPQSLLEGMNKAGQAIYSHPGRQIPIDDVSYEKWFIEGKRNGFAEMPPPVSESAVQLLQMLLSEHDRMSGNQDALQGELPSASTAGITVQELQTAAKGPMSLKAKTLEWTFEWIAHIVMNAVIDPQWFPDSEWDRYLAKYPAVVRAALRQRGQNLSYDVIVSGSAGKAASKQQQANQAFALRQAGAYSIEDLLNSLNVPDPKGVMNRLRDEQQAAQLPQNQGKVKTEPK